MNDIILEKLFTFIGWLALLTLGFFVWIVLTTKPEVKPTSLSMWQQHCLEEHGTTTVIIVRDMDDDFERKWCRIDEFKYVRLYDKDYNRE